MADHDSQKWKGQSRGGGFGTWVFVMLVRHVGLRAAYLLLALVVPYFVLFAPKATRASWLYHRRIRGLGRLRSIAEIFASYFVFGQCIIDKMAVGQGQEHLFNFQHENVGNLKELLNSGEPAIVLSAHVAAWECGAPFFASFGRKMNVTMFLAEHADVQRAIDSQANDRTFNVIPIGTDGLDSVIRIKNALEAGEFVCFMGDRFMTGSPTTKARLLNHEATFSLAPFQLAASMNVPVYFYFAMREPGRSYRFFFQAVRPDGSRSARFSLLNDYIAALEKVICRYPRQWFNFYDYWNLL